VRSTTVLEITTAEQEALLRELRQARYGHLLAIHILLLCAAGKNPTEIADFLFCSRSSVYRSIKAYRAARLDWQRDDQSSPCLSRWQKALRSLIKLSPRVLGLVFTQNFSVCEQCVHLQSNRSISPFRERVFANLVGRRLCDSYVRLNGQSPARLRGRS